MRKKEKHRNYPRREQGGGRRRTGNHRARPGPASDRSSPFDKLTAVQPNERLRLETDPSSISMRILDMIAPIGKGQRGLIVAPPRSGKTILLKQIALAVGKNHPEVQGIVLLVDERPEEVTDFRRSLKEINFEVVASNNDQTSYSHVDVTEQVLARAKALVLERKDVLILFDSLTRMTRAYNMLAPNRSRTMSGGIDSTAFQGPRAFFGAARKLEEGGSLTIIGSVLVDTGSRMDQVIFEEFKGTGNLELYLNRELAELRIFPAFDLMRSGTRREELLIDEKRLAKIHRMRRALADRKPADAMQALIAHMNDSKTNDEFLAKLA